MTISTQGAKTPTPRVALFTRVDPSVKIGLMEITSERRLMLARAGRNMNTAELADGNSIIAAVLETFLAAAAEVAEGKHPLTAFGQHYQQLWARMMKADEEAASAVQPELEQ